MASMTAKAIGKHGIWKSLIENGFDANDLHTNGACIEDDRSTTCARNTKSATLSWYPVSIQRNRSSLGISVFSLYILICPGHVFSTQGWIREVNEGAIAYLELEKVYKIFYKIPFFALLLFHFCKFCKSFLPLLKRGTAYRPWICYVNTMENGTMFSWIKRWVDWLVEMVRHFFHLSQVSGSGLVDEKVYDLASSMPQWVGSARIRASKCQMA